MNERIRELALQAILELEKDIKDGKKDWYHSTQSYNEMIQEKFAELIVRECSNKIEDQKDTAPPQVAAGLNFAQVIIKEHFGVE